MSTRHTFFKSSDTLTCVHLAFQVEFNHRPAPLRFATFFILSLSHYMEDGKGLFRIYGCVCTCACESCMAFSEKNIVGRLELQSVILKKRVPVSTEPELTALLSLGVPIPQKINSGPVTVVYLNYIFKYRTGYL